MKIEPFKGPLMRQKTAHRFKTKTGREGCQYTYTIVLTPEQEAWLRRWYPEVENPILLKASGMSHSTLHRFAREFGLVKSEKGIKGIRKRQAAHIKKVCEANGYYDSLRGKPVSEACLQATAKMWQEIRDGKREHPFKIMKRTNPRKYKKWLERRSEARREQVRKEIRREIYGLPRKTKLKIVVMNKFTRSQVCHRYYALKRGYILMEDCSEQSGERYNIYYDDLTDRAPIFERNLIKDGFNLMKYET